MECSHYGVNLTAEDINQLEIVEEIYFKTREIEEEANEDDYSDSNSSTDNEDNDTDQDVAVEIMEINETERSKVQAFYSETCKCKMGLGGMACSATLSLDNIIECRNNCSELSSAELDLVILGIIHSSLNCSETCISGRVEKNRQNTRMCFFYHGKRICKIIFLFLHCLQYFRFHSLVKHYKKNGLTLRTHGNAKRLPSSASSIETVERVVKFIKNVAEEQALLLPGRVPGFKRIDVKLLPSNLTKHNLWKTYFDICTSTGQVSVGYSKFCDLWNQLCPFILIMRLATDLCWTCQKNNSQINKSANLPEADKVDVVRKQEEHLRLASGEREYYKMACKETKVHVQAHLQKANFEFGLRPCSYKGTGHYSYDYAQQLHYPANPNQPGPIYFKTPRKCTLFGVCCEAIPRQVNFLIDENVLTGKGANSTISYVHYFFEHHGLGETRAVVHADNCRAQNKNSAFLWYYLWRVNNGPHSSIKCDFLLPGHTKFAPDWCFGLVKQKTRRTFISSLFDIARAVKESASVNVAEFVVLHNGTEFPGTVFCKQYWFSEGKALNLLRNRNQLPQPGQLPDTINPQGISRERAEYLCKEIREFCRDGTENLVAPPV
ncbi:hypothetical protein AWC38_SpisGene2140 [Stylophora pistillata]|uniref:DUF7869 domain-containing protein n=1 Tax=Stylophora pistillata TaxID=50429 RepID=A0A2B4SSY8_STYPI|nr:hypothetical protein AWC38_SpisGene2140 [Stylophora pistillata]